MALTYEFSTFQGSYETQRASIQAFCTSISDFPAKGDSAAWVTLGNGGSAIGGSNWYISNVAWTEQGTIFRLILEARMPGVDWTWNGLAPIESGGSWDMSIGYSTKIISGVRKYGFWNLFGNYSDTDAWISGAAVPITTVAPTWVVEFVSTTNYSNTWRGKSNGTFPVGFSPPVAGTGVYMCSSIQADFELYRAPSTGTATYYYRHFATFRQAPTAPTPGQLTWNTTTYPAWV